MYAMYENFWQYAIFVILAIVSTLYLANHCMSAEFGALMVFLAYLVIAYIVANSMRNTILNTEDEREKSVRLSFDCLIGLFLVVTGYCKYAGKLLQIPGKVLQLPGQVISTGVKGVRGVGRMVGI
jgi:small-conductance mechanosensitive channel